jgi:hypothetical protein
LRARKSAAAKNHPQSDAEVFVARMGEATIDNKNAVIKKIWKGSEVALWSLVEWFHAVESLKLAPL